MRTDTWTTSCRLKSKIFHFTSLILMTWLDLCKRTLCARSDAMINKTWTKLQTHSIIRLTMLTFMLTTSVWAMIILARSRNTNPGKTKWCGITIWYEKCTKSYLEKNGACPLSTEVLTSRTLKMRGTNSHCFWLQGDQDTTLAQGTYAEV